MTLGLPLQEELENLFPKPFDRFRFNRTQRNPYAVIEVARKKLSFLTALSRYSAKPFEDCRQGQKPSFRPTTCVIASISL